MNPTETSPTLVLQSSTLTLVNFLRFGPSLVKDKILPKLFQFWFSVNCMGTLSFLYYVLPQPVFLSLLCSSLHTSCHLDVLLQPHFIFGVFRANPERFQHGCLFHPVCPTIDLTILLIDERCWTNKLQCHVSTDTLSLDYDVLMVTMVYCFCSSPLLNLKVTNWFLNT